MQNFISSSGPMHISQHLGFARAWCLTVFAGHHTENTAQVNIVRFLKKDTSTAFTYIQNPTAARITIPAKAHFCSSTKGKFLDKLREDTARCLGVHSITCHGFVLA